MLNDERRVAAYAEAIRRAVKPGAVVLELGTGTGFMAMLACQAGAARVHAVEPNPAIRVGEQMARENGFADRIVFHPVTSPRLELAERCDVLISDMRGPMPCAGNHLADLIDARERLLTPDAIWVCQTDTLHVAVAEIANPQRRPEVPWDGARWGLDLSAALRYATNDVLHHSPVAAELLSAGATWATIHYSQVASPHVRGRVELRVERDGEGRGLALWFEAGLFGGSRLSTAPGEPPHVYGNLFLPWPRMVPLRRGDGIIVKLDAVATGTSYEWSWRSAVRRGGETLANFQQSKLQGRLFESGTFARRSASHPPAARAELLVEKFLFERIDGKTTQAGLAAALVARFPDQFRDEGAALRRVIDTTERLGL